MKEPVGFVGLGAMGLAMAANLLKAGFPLRVWNRSPEKAQPLVKRGAVLAPNAAATVDRGGIVITMVSNDEALEEVSLGKGGLLEHLGPGGIHLSMSTISPTLSRRLAKLHHEKGSSYLASPVFGKPDVAEAAKLLVCVAGTDAAAKARVRPLQEALGQKVFDFGTDAGAVNVVKLAGNFLIGAAVEAMGEAFTLTQKNGIPREQVYDLFTTTFFDCFVYRTYGKLIATERYEPIGARPSLIRKDIGLLLDAAKDSLLPMPLANIIFDHMTEAVAKGQDDTDWTGFARQISQNAGL
jgi:3-hydroxyisobutyrate dehydrogenase-like beta-hydroxyacid dehydrogenase